MDKTPHRDSEFRIRGNQGAQGRMDLLTVLEHEVGHVLGFEHDKGGMMAETLGTGERWSPHSDATGRLWHDMDAFFALLATHADPFASAGLYSDGDSRTR